MCSSDQFVCQFTKPLIHSFVFKPPFPLPGESNTDALSSADSSKKHALHSLLVSLNDTQTITSSVVANTVTSLRSLDTPTLLNADDPEEEALKHAIVTKLVVAVYAEALDTYLTQATEVEAEAEWWADIERSRLNVTWYLLQTLPGRLLNVARIIVQTVQAKDLPLQLSTLSPASLRKLFPSPNSLHPSALVTTFFPQPLSITSSAFILSPKTEASSAIKKALSYVTLPTFLAQQECRYNRKELEKIRDERADALGRLAQLRGPLAALIGTPSPNNSHQEPFSFLGFLELLNSVVTPETVTSTALDDTFGAIQYLSQISLPSLGPTHVDYLKSQHLLRPSRITLLWPKLLFLPPLALYALRFGYASRVTLFDMLKDARDTVEGFVKGWLVEPLKEVLKTVRAGGAEGEAGVIVSKEGVIADLESLERMTLSLARDELRYDSQQLDALAQKIRVGDLTPIMEIYEEDIRHPLKSAMMGSLLRGLFIQIQKAKVDIDQALSGIDRLLKSQELTFAFVGVAPAFAIVYLVVGLLGGLLGGIGGRGRYGGSRRRREVWNVMRRIERLLITQPTTPLPSLPTGLLLLSVTRLRTYGERYLPGSSSSSGYFTRGRLPVRQAFLEDVADLEDPELGRDAKMRVVERMWRCWGTILGWNVGGFV